jgi:UPF0755 protein
VRRVLVFVGVLVFLSVAGAVGAFVWAERAVDNAGPSSSPEPIVFVVPKGATARQVGRLLEKENLISSPGVWRFHLWRRGGLRVKAGRFSLNAGMSIRVIATALEGSPLPEDEPFAVVEGWRLHDTDAALAAAGFIHAGDYIKEAEKPGTFAAPFSLPPGSLEGYLYPETYRVTRQDFQLHALIQRQLETFAERVYKPRKADIAGGKRTLHELVTMASMLEREEPVPAQRPLIAGILWKRVDRGIPLGVDATSRYRLAEWNDRPAFLKALRDEDDPYNSRLRAGLPPTPLGAPTESSFEAALNPKASEFLYYLHDASRTLHASRNAQEHDALRAKYGVH